MRKAIDETLRRREIQLQYNREHGITPATVKKAIRSAIESEVKARRTVSEAIHATEDNVDQTEIIKLLEEEMLEAAKNLEFERAAQLRDKVNELRGAPVLKSGNAWGPQAGSEEAEQQKIWQPKTPKRGGRRVAK
jgi:excinuclease ABC subunit B